MESELYRNIMGEPETLQHILDHRAEYLDKLGEKYKYVQRVFLLGSGTSYHSGASVKRKLEQLVGVEVTVCYPTAFREMQVLPEGNNLVIGISQSGASAIVIDGVQRCRAKGYASVAISANKDSAIAATAEDFIPLVVGEEKSASTKGYVATMLTLILLGASIGRHKGRVSPEEETELVKTFENHIANFPKLIDCCNSWYEENEQELSEAVKMSVMGYEENYATALEGGLKMLEAVRCHVASYDFEEWLHGAYNALREDNYLFLNLSPSKSDNDLRMKKLIEILKQYTQHVFVITTDEAQNGRWLSAPFSGIDYMEPFEYILPYQIIIARLPEKRGINADRVLIPGFHVMVGSKTYRDK